MLEAYSGLTVSLTELELDIPLGRASASAIKSLKPGTF